MRLDELYGVYKKWLEIDDLDRIDIVLAIALSQKMQEDVPLWLILVGPSGDAKTEQVKALLKNEEEDENCKIISRLTPNTLVSGSPTASDLAPKLNNKILIITDFAVLLTMSPDQKREIWAQLRDLYDGFAGRQAGTGVDKHYKHLRVTFLACSTPDLDQEILVHQSLGTRELIYRTKKKDKNLIKKIMLKTMKNVDLKKKMEDELRFATLGFLLTREPRPFPISAEITEEITKMGYWLSMMRAQGHFDMYSKELIGDVYPEVPSRLVRQLKILYRALMSLDDEYLPEKALRIMWYVVKSSGNPKREKIYKCIENGDWKNTSEIAEMCLFGKGTVFRECQVLWNIGEVERRVDEEDHFGRSQEVSYWRLKPKTETQKQL